MPTAVLFAPDLVKLLVTGYWLFLDSPFRSDVRLPTSDLHLPSPISHLPSPPSYLHIHSHPVHGPQALEVREGVIEPQPESIPQSRDEKAGTEAGDAVFLDADPIAGAQHQEIAPRVLGAHVEILGVVVGIVELAGE